MVASLTAIPWQYFTDTGAVLAGGTINFYTPGTTDAKTIWEDNAKATSASNPQTLNSAGRWDTGGLFFDGIYDVVIKDSAGNSIYTVSNWYTNWSAVGTDLSENLLSNHSFETAGTGSEAVANFTETDPGTLITRDTADQSHGAASLKFTLSQNSEEYVTSDIFPLEELEDVYLSFDIKANNATAQPQIDLNWFDATQTTISTTTFYLGNDGATPTAWERKLNIAKTPVANTAYGKIIIYGNAHATQYTTNFDNVKIGQGPNPSENNFKGMLLRPEFGFGSVTTMTMSAGAYHHDGTVEQVLSWNSSLTFTAGSGGSNSGSTNLGASETHYLYIDDSAVVTLGGTTLTASEFLNSTTAPTWSETKQGWYNGSDRCIFSFTTDGSNQINEFFQNDTMVIFAADVTDLAATNVGGSWGTEVTLAIPTFSKRAQISAIDSASDGFEWRTTGQVDSTGHLLVHNGTKNNTLVVITNASQAIDVQEETVGTSTLTVKTQGWFFGRGT